MNKLFLQICMLFVGFNYLLIANPITVSINKQQGDCICADSVTFKATVSCPGVSAPNLQYMWVFSGTGVTNIQPATSTAKSPTVTFQRIVPGEGSVRAILTVTESQTSSFGADTLDTPAGFGVDGMWANLDNSLGLDDGDSNNETAAYFLQWDGASTSPKVIELERPSGLTESTIPAGLSVTGGGGSGVLSREIDDTQESSTDVVWTCGGRSFVATVVVYKAQVSVYANEGPRNWSHPVGHSWWMLGVSNELRPYYSPDLRTYLDHAGYFPASDWYSATNCNLVLLLDPVKTLLFPCTGVLRMGTAAFGAHQPTGSKSSYVDCVSMMSKLFATKSLYDSPGYYNIFNKNCTTVCYAIIPTSWSFTHTVYPWILSDQLKAPTP
jgi:hypothetical protein